MMAFLIMLVFAFAAVLAPWFFARKDGRKGARDGTILSLIVLAFLPFGYLGWCEQANCGQGALFAAFLIPMCILVGGLVVYSGFKAAANWPEPKKPPADPAPK